MPTQVGTRRRWRAGVMGISMLLPVLGAGPALAGSSVPATLSGEVLIEHLPDGTRERTAGTCDRTGDSTFTFTFSGVATGPYPGTFVEEGTVTIGPQTLAERPWLPNPFEPGYFASSRGFATGPLLRVDVRFTIDSPNGVVSGTKTLTTTQPEDFGVCAEVVDEPFGEVLREGTGFLRDVFAHVSYDARIHTADGVYRDTGESFLFAEELAVTWTECCGSAGGGHFFESFSSALGAPEPLVPASADDCKLGGYLNFPGFRNQGDCVSAVRTPTGGTVTG